jgi:hypothetical protein
VRLDAQLLSRQLRAPSYRSSRPTASTSARFAGMTDSAISSTSTRSPHETNWILGTHRHLHLSVGARGGRTPLPAPRPSLGRLDLPDGESPLREGLDRVDHHRGFGIWNHVWPVPRGPRRDWGLLRSLRRCKPLRPRGSVDSSGTLGAGCGTYVDQMRETIRQTGVVPREESLPPALRKGSLLSSEPGGEARTPSCVALGQPLFGSSHIRLLSTAADR